MHLHRHVNQEDANINIHHLIQMNLPMIEIEIAIATITVTIPVLPPYPAVETLLEIKMRINVKNPPLVPPSSSFFSFSFFLELIDLD